MRRAAELLAALAVATLLAAVPAAPASAAFGLKGLSESFANEDGSPAVQAGTHPFEMTTGFELNTSIDPKVGEVPEGELKDLTISQFEGLVGSQTAVRKCTAAEFSTRSEGYASCPDDTAVGVAAVKAEFEAFPPETNASLHLPIYNLVPPPGVAAEFGFVAANVPVAFDVVVSETAPNNLVARLRDTSQALLVYGSKVTLWGNPADPAHDPLRGKCVGSPTEPTAEPISKGECSGDVEEKPLLTLPRSCQPSPTTAFSALSWQGATAAGTAVSAPIVGCEGLLFTPESSAEPTAHAAESPTGLDFGLRMDVSGLTEPAGVAQSDLRKVVATLPDKMTLNASAGEGLTACTRAQYEAESLAAPPGGGCPESSKIGTAEAVSPLLETPLTGTLYVAQQDDPATTAAGAENPFDSTFALYLVLRNRQFGVLVKQAGKVVADPRTGRLVSSFDDAPQLPFERLFVRFRDGSRAPLATPPKCGRYALGVEMTPWSGGGAVTQESPFEVASGIGGGPCPAAGPGPFQPGFEVGSLENRAGAYSPFSMRLTRRDGEQDLTGFGAVLPPGVTGKLAGVGKCPDAAIAAARTRTGRQELASPSCPDGSQIGRVLAGAGLGPDLTYVPGKVYLGGPFAGDPLSVVAITPAVAGPFDLGNVVVREGLTLNPETAEVQVDGEHADPLPRILAGVPVRLRDLRVFADRPDFVLNPTSCNPSQAKATAFGGGGDPFSSADDVTVTLARRYQAAGCSRLRFKPKLSLKLKGGTKRSSFPALRAVVNYPKGRGYANIRKAVVTLPHSAFLEQGHIGTVCTRVQFAADACPKRSIYGRARALTPLLDEPLEGPVYLRSSSHPLPDLVAALHGVVDIDLVGRIDSVHGSIRTSFESVPDAPVSKFVLSMRGGSRGLIVNSRDLCARPNRATSNLFAQNGKAYFSNPVVGVRCRQKHHGKGHGGRGGGR
jgi:hypothetical protein